MASSSSSSEVGTWDFYKDEIIHKTIMSCSVDVDIVELIQDVNDFVELQIGKLPSLEKISKELKLSVKNLYFSETVKKRIYEKIRNENQEEINLMFTMEKVDNNADCICNIINSMNVFKWCTIKISIIISKPSNLVATKICNNFMEQKIKQSIFSRMCSGNTFKIKI